MFKIRCLTTPLRGVSVFQMKSTNQKINNVIGQLEGVKKMLEDERPCIDVLTQLKASKSAISSLTAGFVEENLTEQFSVVCKKDKVNLVKLIKELSK